MRGAQDDVTRISNIPRRTTMRAKRACIAASVAAVLFVLAPVQGYAEQEDDGPTCTLKTLRGRYLFGGITTLLPPAVLQQSLLAVAGYHTFNGDGTGTDIVTVSINGAVVLENGVVPISYTVNPDCSGTITVPAAQETFGIFVAPNGAEMIAIGTTPGSVAVQGPSRRVSRK
jgi:hypothetical protein